MNLALLLEEQAAARPDQPALIASPSGHDAAAGERIVTFTELSRLSGAAAGMFRAAGVGAGDRVLLLTPMSIALYTALLGLWRVGAAAMVLDPQVGLGHVRQCLHIGRPVGMIGPRRAHLLRWAAGWFAGRGRCWSTDGCWPTTRRWGAHHRFDPVAMVDCSDEAEALLTFTSGSTGEPKAAVRTHGFLRAQHRALAPAIGLEAGEVDLATLPIFALANLAAGVTTVIAAGDLRRVDRVDAEAIAGQIARHAPMRCTASPAFFQRLLEAQVPLARFDKLFTGGAPVFPGLLARLRAACPTGRVTAVYGSTEAEPIAELDADDLTDADRDRMRQGGGLPAGDVVSTIDLCIIDPNGLPETRAELTDGDPAGSAPRLESGALEALTQPAGEPGEVIVTGAHVLRGYLDGRGDATAKLRVGQTVWHRTGDLGYRDPRGRLWLLGRATAAIRDARGTLYPFAVECAVDLLRAAATVEDDPLAAVERTALLAHDGRRVLVVQTTRPWREADGARLMDHLAWAELDAVVSLDRIPLDRRHRAKVDYPALRRALAGRL